MEKIIIVTGGGRGIGAATAYLAAQQGYAIGVNYIPIYRQKVPKKYYSCFLGTFGILI